MKIFLVTLTAMTLSATLAYAQGGAALAKSKESVKEEIKAHHEQVKEACSADVATTGCTGEGKEKMKCLHEYKKANKDFKFSEVCKSAMKDGREERKEMRKERKAKRAAKEENKDTK